MLKIRRLLKEVWVLFVMQFKTFRLMGPMAVVIPGGLPLGLIIFLKFFFKQATPEIILFIISGNLVISLMSICIIMLSQTLANMKLIKSFEYYAVLPINKLSVILGIVLSFLVVSLPGFALLLVIGSLIFNLWTLPHPMIIVVALLTAFSLTGIGAIIGVYSRHFMQTNIISQIVGFGCILVTPVFFKLEALPLPLRYFAYLFPTTYGAEAMRTTLQGICNQRVLIDLLILTLFTIFSFYLTAVKLKWREN